MGWAGVKLRKVLNRSLIVILALLLSNHAIARPPATKTTILRDFVDEKLADVIHSLGEAMGRNVYLGPGIEGNLTVSLRSVPPVAALHEVLAIFSPDVAYKLIGTDTLVVAAPDCRWVALDDPHPRTR